MTATTLMRRLYHRTSAANAANICAGGFRRELRAFRQWLVPGAWLNNRVLTHVIKPPPDSEVM